MATPPDSTSKAPQQAHHGPSTKEKGNSSPRELAEAEVPESSSTALPGETSQPSERADTAAAPEPEKDQPADEREEGEADEGDEDQDAAAAAPAQTTDEDPPLPAEPAPGQSLQPEEDDGWDFAWHAEAQRYYFVNRFSGESTWENPRVASSSSAAAAAAQPAPPPLPTVAGGYNPAIHGDYDTWYAQNGPKEEEKEEQSEGAAVAAAAAAAFADPSLLMHSSGGQFNRLTGRFQRPDQGPERHGDEAKSRRQMNAFFDVDAAANSHDGRSLKAERAGKRLTKGELKHFKEKRKARKEEKRRAWLRD